VLIYTTIAVHLRRRAAAREPNSAGLCSDETLRCRVLFFCFLAEAFLELRDSSCKLGAGGWGDRGYEGHTAV